MCTSNFKKIFWGYTPDPHDKGEGEGKGKGKEGRGRERRARERRGRKGRDGMGQARIHHRGCRGCIPSHRLNEKIFATLKQRPSRTERWP
jgi:hypothetical protein